MPSRGHGHSLMIVLDENETVIVSEYFFLDKL